MEYCFWRGFLVVLFMQSCTSEDLSSSIQSPTVVNLQDGQEPPMSPAEVVPVVAPPSLKEVEQAVQEASEQVESRGAGEVLKELLERVVEAALGQVDGGAEVKPVEGPEEEEGEATSDLAAEVEKEDEGLGMNAGYAGVGEEHELAGEVAFEHVAEEDEGDTAAGSVEETTTGVGTGGREGDGVEVINESLSTEASQGLAEATSDAPAEEAGTEDNNEQVVAASEERGAADTSRQETEETPAMAEAAGDEKAEKEAVEQSDAGLAASDAERLADALEKDELLEEETQVDESESELTVITDDFQTEIRQTAAGERVGEEGEVPKGGERPEVEGKQGGSAVEGGEAEVEGAEGRDAGEAAVGEGEGASERKEESASDGGEEQAGGEERTSHSSHTKDQETLVISAPEPEGGAEASVEQNPKNQAPTPSPSLGGVEMGDGILDEAKSNRGNEIITPTDDLLPRNPAVAQPTLDNAVKDVLAGEDPQAQGEEPGEANELVEDTSGSAELGELGLESWKIGAISVAAFLVLETTVIVIYVLKCRNKNNTPAIRACEEGCVEPEAATGADCSDDTLPAGNGDTQQIAALDPADVALTLARTAERHDESGAIAMSDLAPGSRDESANAGPGPDSSQDLRTSVL